MNLSILFAPSGGQYIPEQYFTKLSFNGAVSPNQEIVIINAAVNKQARLESLVGGDEQDSYDIEVDGNLIVTSKKLTDLIGTTGQFYISQSGFVPSSAYMHMVLSDIVGSQIIIRFRGGSGVATIDYSYSTGRV